MRAFMGMCTIVGVVSIGSLDAGGTKRVDVPKLIGELKNSKNASARAAAAAEIGRYGSLSGPAVKDAIEPLLLALKNDESADVRRAAAKALGDIAPEPMKTVPALIDALKDRAVGVKTAAAVALGQYGPDARPAIPALRELAKDKSNKKTSKIAQGALKMIGGKKKKG
ncbi:MAG: HEAT repeat domain-containing protein [Gemmataceae bacterium]|nr:HEAT repeat domain-containing protein [Gemmataceae bacterium]